MIIGLFPLFAWTAESENDEHELSPAVALVQKYLVKVIGSSV